MPNWCLRHSFVLVIFFLWKYLSSLLLTLLSLPSPFLFSLTLLSPFGAIWKAVSFENPKFNRRTLFIWKPKIITFFGFFNFFEPKSCKKQFFSFSLKGGTLFVGFSKLTAFQIAPTFLSFLSFSSFFPSLPPDYFPNPYYFMKMNGVPKLAVRNMRIANKNQ